MWVLLTVTKASRDDHLGVAGYAVGWMEIFLLSMPFMIFNSVALRAAEALVELSSSSVPPLLSVPW